jgi:hypothetical protein
MLEWALTQLEMGRSVSHNDLQVQALNLASDNAFKVGGRSRNITMGIFT